MSRVSRYELTNIGNNSRGFLGPRKDLAEGFSGPISEHSNSWENKNGGATCKVPKRGAENRLQCISE